MKSADGMYRGEITRITSRGIFVMVPKLGANVEYGPCSRLIDVRTTASGGGPYDHSHDIFTGYQPGRQVLVTTINGVPDDLVVLGLID